MFFIIVASILVRSSIHWWWAVRSSSVERVEIGRLSSRIPKVRSL
jgi:hypothetical protein